MKSRRLLPYITRGSLDKKRTEFLQMAALVLSEGHQMSLLLSHIALVCQIDFFPPLTRWVNFWNNNVKHMNCIGERKTGIFYFKNLFDPISDQTFNKFFIKCFVWGKQVYNISWLIIDIFYFKFNLIIKSSSWPSNIQQWAIIQWIVNNQSRILESKMATLNLISRQQIF